MKIKLVFIFLLAHSLDLMAMNLYFRLSAHEKREFLWKNIIASTYNPLPTSQIVWKKLLPDFKAFLTTGLYLVDDDDIHRERTPKTLITHAAVAKVSFVPSLNGFSGILKSGAIGLMRYALVGDPEALGVAIPHMSLKFFIDDSPSENARFIGSFDRVFENNHWFLKPMSSIMKPLKKMPLKPVELVVFMALKEENSMPLNALCRRNLDGRLVFDEKVPYEIVIEPNTALADLLSADLHNDFRSELAKIPKDHIVYCVRAKSRPDSEFYTIGHLILESNFVASDYGDMRIVF